MLCVCVILFQLTDLLFFISLLVVFLISYGIAAQSLLYPNATLSWNILRDVLYMPYFNIYGEFNLDEVRGRHPSLLPRLRVSSVICSHTVIQAMASFLPHNYASRKVFYYFLPCILRDNDR